MQQSQINIYCMYFVFQIVESKRMRVFFCQSIHC